jgi:polyphenol oxidase
MTTIRAKTSRAIMSAAGLSHGFYTRHGGVSEGIYASLNCGLGSNDNRDSVLENRRRVASQLGAPDAPLLTCYQTHSATAVIVDQPWHPDAQPRADALVTRTEGLILGTLAADCTPILCVDATARVIAAAHAGWKGALGGIVEATFAAMEHLGARRDRITAAIGPCIGRDAYEVGAEFKSTFLNADPDFARYFHQPAHSERPHFDLPTFVADRLRQAGCQTVDLTWDCTYKNPSDYFSFRRSTHRAEPDYGRQISAITLTKT